MHFTCFFALITLTIHFKSHDHGDEGGGYHLGNEDGQAFQGAASVLATEEGYEGYEEAFDQGEGGYYEPHEDKVRTFKIKCGRVGQSTRLLLNDIY